MKHVVSVSLGSTNGDFVREIELAGQKFHVAREGMNGDIERAINRIAEIDGHVDAIGLGGIDLYLSVGGQRYTIGDGQRMADAAKQTPVVDGSGLKNSLERRVVRELAAQGLVSAESKVLMVSALDRFGMAEAFVELGCECVFGDLIFNIGLDYPLTDLSEIEKLAEKYRSRLLTVPFHLLYPTGASQDSQGADPRYAKYYHDADIIAGDAHLILRHLPNGLDRQGIVTNTTRPHTRKRFADAGARWVATTTPDMDGVSGGTNVMEAALIAASGKRPPELSAEDYQTWVESLHWHGSVHMMEEKSRHDSR